MKKITILLAGLALTGCTNLKYPNWQYVRIEKEVPSPSCIYKMQEACADGGANCFDWYKQRATKYDANTVVITQSEAQKRYSVGVWSAGGGDINNQVADYYYCNSPKNLNPK
ncbi:MAG: hypothetical protein Q8M20_18025 [Rhodocyclaceae bacterium]|nr:hypothetical protein [Rhodocyclaceae bacterium]